MDEQLNTDPTLSVFHDCRIAAYGATLTQDGEICLIPIDHVSIHEDAPLQIDGTIKDDDHALQS